MVFLGLEKPVEYGRQLIFDPTTALMVLLAQDQYANALYRDYVRGLEDMKEFNKEYGNFMTPFGADQEWYNKNVIDKVRGTIQRMYEAGIDPTRSVQGRAAISQLINSVDVGTVNAMKDNAKIGYAYLDAMQDLRRKGKYSEAQELFDIMLTGGTNFKDFATRGPGGKLNTWDRSSPIEATSLLDLTFDSYKGRTPRDLTADDLRAAGIPYDPRYQYTGYLDSDLMKVAPGAAMAIAADPRAAYFRNLAKLKVAARGGNYTQADVDALFYRDIADANKWALVDPTKKADQFAVLKELLKNSLTALRLGKALDYYYKMMENGADVNGDGKLSQGELSNYAMMKNASLFGNAGYTYDPSTGNMMSPNGQSIEFTDYRQMTSTLNRNSRIQLNMGLYIQEMIDSEQAHIDLYNKYLDENRTGIRKGSKETMSMSMPFGTLAGLSWRTYKTKEYTPTEKVSKHSESEMKQLRTLAKEALLKISNYKTFFNNDGSVNYDKLVRAGYLEQDGSPTEYLIRKLNKLNKVSQSLPEDQRRKRADDTYMLYAGDAPSPGTGVHDRLVSDFAGNNKVKVPGLPNEMRKVNLNHYTLSTVRRGDITGVNVYDKNSDVKRAQLWLRTNKVEGYIDDESVNDAFVPNASGTRMNNDLFGDALVDKKYIDRMCADLNIKSKEAKDRLLESLGIVAYEKQTTVPENKNDIDYKWVTYYSIPITKIYDSGVIQGDRNVEFRKSRHGQANATAAERNSYAAGMQSTLTTR